VCHAARYAARNLNTQRLAGYTAPHVRHLIHQTQSSGAAHKTLLLFSKGFFLFYVLRLGLYLELLQNFVVVQDPHFKLLPRMFGDKHTLVAIPCPALPVIQCASPAYIAIAIHAQ